MPCRSRQGRRLAAIGWNCRSRSGARAASRPIVPPRAGPRASTSSSKSASSRPGRLRRRRGTSRDRPRRSPPSRRRCSSSHFRQHPPAWRSGPRGSGRHSASADAAPRAGSTDVLRTGTRDRDRSRSPMPRAGSCPRACAGRGRRSSGHHGSTIPPAGPRGGEAARSTAEPSWRLASPRTGPVRR